MKSVRVSINDIAECQKCHENLKIRNTARQLCGVCANQERYVGEMCEHPTCTGFGDGKTHMVMMNGKMLCVNCKMCWAVFAKGQSWDDFVKYRNKVLARPPTFQNTKFKPVKTPLKGKRPKAECQKCNKTKTIENHEYQFCSGCTYQEQYIGFTCECCSQTPNGGTKKTYIQWDKEEALLVCCPCAVKKRGRGDKPALVSYKVLKEDILTVKDCGVCGRSVRHTWDGAGKADGAAIDHDHSTGKIRGVLCNTCNQAEGKLHKHNPCIIIWAKQCDAYVRNPPMGGMNLQVVSPTLGSL
jgi:hypothetical protein